MVARAWPCARRRARPTDQQRPLPRANTRFRATRRRREDGAGSSQAESRRHQRFEAQPGTARSDRQHRRAALTAPTQRLFRPAPTRKQSQSSPHTFADRIQRPSDGETPSPVPTPSIRLGLWPRAATVRRIAFMAPPPYDRRAHRRRSGRSCGSERSSTVVGGVVAVSCRTGGVAARSHVERIGITGSSPRSAVNIPMPRGTDARVERPA